jgi:predicted nucleic acid-binding Zn finger protein
LKIARNMCRCAAFSFNLVRVGWPSTFKHISANYSSRSPGERPIVDAAPITGDKATHSVFA